MSDAVQNVLEKVREVAGCLGWPVDFNRPYNLKHDDLPRVSVWSGSERTVSEGSYAMWAEQVELGPIVEVLVEHDDPMLIGDAIQEAWNTLRSAIRGADWAEFTSDGTAPSYEKTGLVVEDKPGVSGFAVTLNLQVDLD